MVESSAPVARTIATMQRMLRAVEPNLREAFPSPAAEDWTNAAGIAREAHTEVLGAIGTVDSIDLQKVRADKGPLKKTVERAAAFLDSSVPAPEGMATFRESPIYQAFQDAVKGNASVSNGLKALREMAAAQAASITH